MHIIYRFSISFMVTILLLSVLTFNRSQASAYYEGFDENNPPKLESISINKNVGKYNNEIEIKATILNASMADMAYLRLKNIDTDTEIDVQKYKKNGDQYVFEFKIDENISLGHYIVKDINLVIGYVSSGLASFSFNNEALNLEERQDEKNENLANANLNVVENAPDLKGPDLKNIKVNNVKPKLGETIKFTINAYDFNDIDSAELALNHVAKNVNQYVPLVEKTEGSFEGTVKITSSMLNGQWRVAAVDLVDTQSNLSRYTNNKMLKSPGDHLFDFDHVNFIVPEKITNTTPTMSEISNISTSVTGKAKSDSVVKLLVNNKVIGSSKTKEGKYKISFNKLPAGTKVTLYSDYKGVKSTLLKKIVIDKLAPAPPTISKLTSKSTAIVGKGEKGTKVYVYKKNKLFAKGLVNSKGAFSIKISKQKTGTDFVVKLTDNSGNTSKGKSIKVSK